MKQGIVYNNDIVAGIISQLNDGTFKFEYDINYYNNPYFPAISLNLPKNQQVYLSDTLFPFFYNLLSEGSNKKTQNQYLKIDERDYFELLLKTAHSETIGAIHVKEIKHDTIK